MATNQALRRQVAHLEQELKKANEDRAAAERKHDDLILRMIRLVPEFVADTAIRTRDLTLIRNTKYDADEAWENAEVRAKDAWDNAEVRIEGDGSLSAE